jgi:Holliday junction resolvasome RuvABC endonuclease subunit
VREKWKIERIDIDIFDKMPKGLVIGIDPGTVHLGICILWVTQVTLYQVTLIRNDDPIQRIQDVQKVIAECIHAYPYTATVCIEGASFGDRYRQVELAEQRASIALWALNRSFDVRIVPPNTIRKKVFLSAKVKAHEVWDNLPQDCAAALSCALSVSL